MAVFTSLSFNEQNDAKTRVSSLKVDMPSRVYGEDLAFKNPYPLISYFVYIVMLVVAVLPYYTSTSAEWKFWVEQKGEFNIVVLYSFVLSTGVYWIVGLAWFAAERVFDLQPYKIQPELSVSLSDWWLCANNVAGNQILINLPMLVLYYLWRQKSGVKASDMPPSVIELIFHIAIIVAVYEVWYFATHWLAHHPLLYKHVHKQHHQFRAPTAIGANYAHPIEHALINVFPIILGPMLMRSHIITLWFWLVLGITSSVNSHCGYVIPYLRSPTRHDFHHSHFNVNYAPVGQMDRYFGTDTKYQKLVQKVRKYI